MAADGFKGDALPAQRVPRIVTLSGIGERQPVLTHILASSGVVVEEVADAQAVLTRLRDAPNPDLIVLEWGLSDTRAIEGMQDVLASVRESSVLLLVAAPRPDVTETEGVPGADETQPAMERSRRQAAPPAGSVAASAGPEQRDKESAVPPNLGEGHAGALRLEGCRAYWNGRRVALSLTEFRVVSRLATSPGVDFSHRDIYDIMKGEGIVSGRGEGGYRGNVRAAIKRIRRKFVSIDPGFAAIRNYHGFGYHWDEGVAADTPEPAEEAIAL